MANYLTLLNKKEGTKGWIILALVWFFFTNSNILKSTKFPILISNVRMLIILEYGNFSFIEQIKLGTRVIYMHNWSGKIGNIYATMK